MKVTIMYRNSFEGGDGWTYFPMNVEIYDNCPVCGAKRGTPRPYSWCEDGEYFIVDTWKNSCGHVDKYKNVFFEACKLQKERSSKPNVQ